jgi:hypothetical protein
MGLHWAQQKGSSDMSEYWFKPAPEAVRAVIIAAFVAAIGILSGVDFTDMTSLHEWQALAIGVLSGAAHAAFVAIQAQLGPGGFGSGPKPEAGE